MTSAPTNANNPAKTNAASTVKKVAAERFTTSLSFSHSSLGKRRLNSKPRLLEKRAAVSALNVTSSTVTAEYPSGKVTISEETTAVIE